MKTNKIGLMLAILLSTGIGIIFYGCKKESEETPSTNEVILNDNAKVISESTWQASIVSVDSSTFTYVFNSSISSMNIKKGDVLVGSTGNGMLRKVDSVYTAGSNIEVKTSQARLTDLFKQAKIDIRKALTLSQVKSIKYFGEGVKLKPSSTKSTDETTFTWNIDKVIYDLDGNPNTTNDQVKLTGDFSFDSQIIFQVDIGFFTIDRIQLGFEATQDLNLALSAKLNYNLQKSEPVLAVAFTPFKLPVGPVTLVIAPVFTIDAGIDGSSDASMTTSVQENFSYQAGVIYQDGWSTYNDKTFTYGYQPPEVNLNASVKAYIKPKLTLWVYGVVGPYVDATLYGKINVNISSTPWWKLYGGYDVGVGVNVQVFGYDIYDYYHPDILQGEELIAQASTNTDLPTVNTDSVTNITETTATCGGNVISQGTSAVIVRGVCWSTSQNPTINDPHTSDGSGTGVFTSNITGLSKDTPYNVRAYATNSSGTNYGNQVLFRTKGGAGGVPCPGIPTITYEGKTYNTVQIGTQCWLKENLDIGEMINSNQSMTNNGKIEKYCYDNDPVNCVIYGGLYLWDEMMQYTTQAGSKGICPAGWHITTWNEWSDLEQYFAPPGTEGGKMKETGTLHWIPPNTGATNEGGFTGLPAGTIDFNGAFNSIGYYGKFWSSNQEDAGSAYFLGLMYNSPWLATGSDHKSSGNSVRCLKN